MKRDIAIGDTFGRLSFAGDAGELSKDKRLLSYWICACGSKTKQKTGRVICGYKIDCGCGEKSRRRNGSVTHGKRGSKAYSSWQAIKRRCLNKNDKDFARYGGAGIGIHDPWISSFEEFYKEVGDSPSEKHQIDRIDNRIGYYPGNIRWATPKMQSENTKKSKRWFIKGIVFEGIADAANHFGVSTQTIFRWCNGQLDKRDNSFTKKRPDCWSEKKYE